MLVAGRDGQPTINRTPEWTRMHADDTPANEPYKIPRIEYADGLRGKDMESTWRWHQQSLDGGGAKFRDDCEVPESASSSPEATANPAVKPTIAPACEPTDIPA